MPYAFRLACQPHTAALCASTVTERPAPLPNRHRRPIGKNPNIQLHAVSSDRPPDWTDGPRPGRYAGRRRDLRDGHERAARTAAGECHGGAPERGRAELRPWLNPHPQLGWPRCGGRSRTGRGGPPHRPPRARHSPARVYACNHGSCSQRTARSELIGSSVLQMCLASHRQWGNSSRNSTNPCANTDGRSPRSPNERTPAVSTTMAPSVGHVQASGWLGSTPRSK